MQTEPQQAILKIYSHVKSLSETDCDQLQVWAQAALPECLGCPSSSGSIDLPNLREVEISIVDDETITGVHADFLDDPTPTDVITFQHGEILISYDTAESIVSSEGHSVLEELFLYIVHGLLHLNGHLDADEIERNVMHKVQNRIWREVLDSAV